MTRVPLPEDLSRKISDKASKQMLPGLSLANPSDSRLVHAQGVRHSLMTQGRASNPEHHLVGELGLRPFHPVEGPPSLNHFLGVIRSRPQMKMKGLDANTPITRVQDTLIFVQGPTVNPVGHSVRPNRNFPHPEDAVPVISKRGRPIPTPLGQRGGDRRVAGHKPVEHLHVSHAGRSHPTSLQGYP